MPKPPKNAAQASTQDAPQVALLRVELVPIDSVKPDPANVREHNERSIDSLCADLSHFGQQKPIVVDAHGIIKAGNGTWKAAKRLGWPVINIVRTGLDPKSADLYAVADNRTGELSFFDETALAASLQGLDEAQLLALGFDAGDVDMLLQSQNIPVEDVKEQAGKRQGTPGQVSVRLMIVVANVDTVERALSATGEINRERALLTVCESYLDATARQLHAHR